MRKAKDQTVVTRSSHLQEIHVFQPVGGEQLTFDPDVAVPLEVVVGSFPGVPVVPQKSDRRSRPDWYITHSFFIWKSETSVGLDKTH